MGYLLNKHRFGFFEIAEKPTEEELSSYYAEKYFQESKGAYEDEYTPDELNYFRARLEQHHCALQASTLGKTFLDVGCGEGFSMAYFREHGSIVKGIDFSSAGLESKNPGVLDALTTGNLFDLLQAELLLGNLYDIVWVQNVLEHVLNPVDLMKTLKSLVSPDGIAVITVPNDYSSIQKEAMERGHIDRPFWVSPPDHLSYFDRESLCNIAIGTGWIVADLLGDFPIDWYLYHPGSNYVMDPSVGKNAHIARVQLELLFAERPVEDVLEFRRALSKMGSGRNLTMFIKPAKD